MQTLHAEGRLLAAAAVSAAHSAAIHRPSRWQRLGSALPCMANALRHCIVLTSFRLLPCMQVRLTEQSWAAAEDVLDLALLHHGGV